MEEEAEAKKTSEITENKTVTEDEISVSFIFDEAQENELIEEESEIVEEEDTSSSSSNEESFIRPRLGGSKLSEVKISSGDKASFMSSNQYGKRQAAREKHKSTFSLFSAVSGDSNYGVLAGFEQVWGKSNEWLYGRLIRDMAKTVHAEHGQRAMDLLGAIPHTGQDTRQETPAPSKVTISSMISSHSISSYNKSPSMSAKPITSGDLCYTDTKKETLTEIRDEINEEEYFFKQIHPQFSGYYSVLIWTPQDSITPRARLNSPYEIVALSFCPHDGNYLVGGTSSGIVVLWDLTGKLESKSEALHYSTDPSFLESQRVINSHLKWRRSKKSFNQIHPTAITPLKDSHNRKIIDIQWISADKEFDIKTGKVFPRFGTSKPTLQFITTSEDQVIKVWDMRCEPKPAIGLRFPDKGFSRTAAAKRPAFLQHSVSKYSELHRRWPCMYTAEPKHDDSAFFFSTCSYNKIYYQERLKSVGKTEDDKVLEGAFIGCLNGDVGYMTWEGTPFESLVGPIDTITTQVFKTYHDGPVNCVARHPVLEHICLTTGGHIFAIWNLNFPSEPIKWVRYRETVLTYCEWSHLKHSIFIIARADGLIEFWDLLIYSHRPKVDPLSTGAGITIICSYKHFIAVADVNASLRLYFIQGTIKPLTEAEFEHLREMVDTEPERKTQSKEWSNKWIAEHVGRKNFNTFLEKEEGSNLRTSVSKVKDTEHPPCNPFMLQLYKWYVRRRGDKSVWLDEADKKWFEQERAHMKSQILANKMWNQKKMDVVMRQLDIKEKREMVRKQRVQEILDQADEIFKLAVSDVFLKKEIELKASKISVKIDEPKEFDISAAFQETQLLFGVNSNKFEKIKMEDVARFPVKERKMLDVLAKYRQVRMVFNDSRRNRDSKLKWLRNKLRKEVERYGCELIETQTKTNTLMKWEKYERRIRDIETLREMYGVLYKPLWDKDKRISKFEKRMALGNIPVTYTVAKKEKRKVGLDLESIIQGKEISVLTTSDQVESRKVSFKKLEEPTKDLVVEEETTVILPEPEATERKSLLVQEPLDQFTAPLPEIKKSVSFSSKEGEALTGGVLPLPDIVPRSESEVETPVEQPRLTVDKDFRPYIETLLSQPTELSDTSDIEDFEPDIAVMEAHKDVDEIVDKLSSVYAMLKADVNIKPELHRFKWETTEEYLVSDEEEEKKSGMEEEEMEGEDAGLKDDNLIREVDDELGSNEYIEFDSNESVY